jgi:very-short-patch-repair endonuclease
VLERLRAQGFHAEPQVDVGGHPIDIVVSDGRQQVAIECDGDRLQPPARIGADMARQAVLERVGWRFIRVRATRFFRDRDATMDGVFAELGRLGVGRGIAGDAAVDSIDPAGENLRNKIVRRAWQLMREHEWIEGGEESSRPRLVPAADADEEVTSSITLKVAPEEMGSEVAELVLEDTTEPNFVILEQWEDQHEKS